MGGGDDKAEQDELKFRDDAYVAPEDRRECRRVLARAREGDADAQFQMGLWLEEGRILKMNPPAAGNWFRVAARQGNLDAEAFLAYGRACDDLKWLAYEGRRRLEKAAAAGSLRAKGFLGATLWKGSGGKRDGERAVALLREAAEAGDPVGLCYLGAVYREGEYAERDLEKAVALFKKAADLAFIDAMYFLADC